MKLGYNIATNLPEHYLFNTIEFPYGPSGARVWLTEIDEWCSNNGVYMRRAWLIDPKHRQNGFNPPILVFLSEEDKANFVLTWM